MCACDCSCDCSQRHQHSPGHVHNPAATTGGMAPGTLNTWDSCQGVNCHNHRPAEQPQSRALHAEAPRQRGRRLAGGGCDCGGGGGGEESTSASVENPGDGTGAIAQARDTLNGHSHSPHVHSPHLHFNSGGNNIERDFEGRTDRFERQRRQLFGGSSRSSLRGLPSRGSSSRSSLSDTDRKRLRARLHGKCSALLDWRLMMLSPTPRAWRWRTP